MHVWCGSAVGWPGALALLSLLSTHAAPPFHCVLLDRQNSIHPRGRGNCQLTKYAPEQEDVKLAPVLRREVLVGLGVEEADAAPLLLARIHVLDAAALGSEVAAALHGSEGRGNLEGGRQRGQHEAAAGARATHAYSSSDHGPSSGSRCSTM